jgi:hypothetical protein
MNLESPPYPARSVEIMESSAATGEWTVPAFEEVSVALALSDFSASWRGRRGQHRSTLRPALSPSVNSINRRRSR